MHHIHTQSNLITGFFPVAVRACCPIDGTDRIMGNDKAGGRKVCPVPRVVGIPISEHDLTQRHPGVFPVNVLTRAQACKRTQDVELSDSLFVSVLSEDGMLGTP